MEAVVGVCEIFVGVFGVVFNAFCFGVIGVVGPYECGGRDRTTSNSERYNR